MEAKLWLKDMTNLLAVARVPALGQVEMVKILLTDIARSWWLAEEERLTRLVTWEQFSACFYERFFPKTAKREMKQRFIHLKQYDRSVDAYAAEFLRLSRFSPSMVADEEDRANRFQQGLRWEI